MKPVTIDHPFRTMSLGTVGEASLRPLEQEAIEKYTALHNVTYELKQLLNKLINDYTTVMETRQQCQQAFNNLQNEYVLLAPMLHYYEEGHYLPDEEVEEVNEEERVCYDTTSLLIQLDEFKIRYYHYAEKVMAIENEHNNLQQIQDKLDATFDDFDDNYFSPIVRDYQNAQIDIVALDKDFDDYKGDLHQVSQLTDRMYDTRNAFIELHNQLYKSMQELDKDLAKLFAMLKKMNGEGE
jgi:hypothetical protein